MSRNDLKQLIQTIERVERNKRLYRALSAIAVTVAVVGGTVFTLANHATPAGPVAIVPSAPAVNSYAGIKTTGHAAIVYDLTTGATLYEQNADAQLPLASLTKLLTVYAAANILNSNTAVSISPTALATEGGSGLSAGETFAFKDIAQLALVASSNDAAAAIV